MFPLLFVIALALVVILVAGTPIVGPPDDKLRYSVVFDAGSTGSRVHIYRFRIPTTGGIQLLSETFVETKPGLSHYASDPDAAAASILPLLRAAQDAVPSEARPCTPVTLRATAGLRLLPHGAAGLILRQVRARLSVSGFALPPEDEAVSVLSGEAEGIGAWLTVNYLLGNVRVGAGPDPQAQEQQQERPQKRPKTVAIVDLGGASTQVVFEPRNVAVLQSAAASGFASQALDARVYSHSHLGFGLMEARKRIDAAGGAAACTPTPGAGAYAACATVVRGVLSDGKACAHTEGCSIGGKWHPHLHVHFLSPEHVARHAAAHLVPHTHGERHNAVGTSSNAVGGGKPQRAGEAEIFAFSYVYDRLLPFLAEDDPGVTDHVHGKGGVLDSAVVTVAWVRAVAAAVCTAGSPARAVVERMGAEAAKWWCADVVYIAELFGTAYHLPDGTPVHVAKKLHGTETAWCLGLALPTLADTAHLPPQCHW